MVDGLGKQTGGDLVVELNRADPACQNKLDLPGADLLVELHRQEDLPFVRGAQVQLSREAGALEEPIDALALTPEQAEALQREFPRDHLADGNRFTVEILAVIRNGFEIGRASCR